MGNPLFEEMRRISERKKEEAHERKLADIRAGVIASPTVPSKIRWHGTAVDFADWIFDAWSKKKIDAATETALFELASQHFCQKNGTAFKKRSLLVSRKFRKDFGKLNR